MDIGDLLRDFRVGCLEGRVRFNRPAPVRRLATATLRGLAGHALAAVAPGMVSRHFKPGAGNNRPAAYLFQPVHDEVGLAGSIPFRIVAWDREGELIPAMAQALRATPGRPFGESGANIAEVECSPEEALGFSGLGAVGSRFVIQLRSPVRIPAGDGWVSDGELALGHLVKAAVSRLNLLSGCYGRARMLDPVPLLAKASFAREIGRELRWVSLCRRSSTQHKDLCLSGIVGVLEYAGLTEEVVNLLLAASVFHVGRHTVEGCGHLLLSS